MAVLTSGCSDSKGSQGGRKLCKRVGISLYTQLNTIVAAYFYVFASEAGRCHWTWFRMRSAKPAKARKFARKRNVIPLFQVVVAFSGTQCTFPVVPFLIKVWKMRQLGEL